MVLARSTASFSSSIRCALLRRSHLLSLIACDMFIVSMTCVWSCHRHNELTYNTCLTRFYMWVQHIVCPTVVEEEKKDQIHDQNGDEPNLYVSSNDIRDREKASRVLAPRRQSRWFAPPPVALGLGGGPWSLAGGWFRVLCLGCFLMSSLKWRLHLKVRIRFSPSYPIFGDVSSDRGHVEMCVLPIF
jgi:hypothetical protein